MKVLLTFTTLSFLAIGSEAQVSPIRNFTNPELISRVAYDPFGCQPRCWDRCLENFYGTNFYRYAKRFVDLVRGLKISNPRSKGTVFILDSTAEDLKFEYQQTLAAIAAIVMPVEYNDRYPNRSCNPFFHAQYFEFGVWGWVQPQYECLDHCDAAEALLNLPNLPEKDYSPDWLEGGCALGNVVRETPSPEIPCANEGASRDELAIAFINHPDQGNLDDVEELCDRFPRDNKLQVSIWPGNFNTGFDALRHAYMWREDFLEDAQRLYSCMRRSCCIRNPNVTVKKIDFSKSRVLFQQKLSGNERNKNFRPIEASAADVLKKYGRADQRDNGEGSTKN